MFRRIQLQSRRTTAAKEAQSIFPCFTVCNFGRDLERDGLGWVVPTNRKVLFHSSHAHPKFQTRIFGRMESAQGLYRYVLRQRKIETANETFGQNLETIFSE